MLSDKNFRFVMLVMALAGALLLAGLISCGPTEAPPAEPTKAPVAEAPEPTEAEAEEVAPTEVPAEEVAPTEEPVPTEAPPPTEAPVVEEETTIVILLPENPSGFNPYVADTGYEQLLMDLALCHRQLAGATCSTVPGSTWSGIPGWPSFPVS